MSARSVVILAVLGTALPGPTPIHAQQTPAANPLDVVPDKMPFDIPYGAPISLEHAEAAIAATVAEARKQDWKLNVAVVDSGGNLVAFQRMDGRSSRQSRSPSTRRALPPPSVAKRRCSRTPFSRAISTM